MQPIGQNRPAIVVRYRTMLTLWFAMTMSLLMWLVLIRVVTVTSTVNQKLGLLLICLSLVPMSLSFLVKQIVLGKAIQQQSPASVQQPYVVAWALSEASALIGLLANFVAASPYFYAAFVVGGLGMLLHIPQKKHLLAASGQEF